MVEAVRRNKGKAFPAKVGKIAFAVTVYCLRQERNQCIFGHKWMTEEQFIMGIEAYVVAKVWYWTTPRNYEN